MHTLRRGLCLHPVSRRAIKIYVYRNANSNVNQEAAKLLISRGNFLRAATRRDATRRDATDAGAMHGVHVRMRANGASAFCLSAYDLREGTIVPHANVRGSR